MSPSDRTQDHIMELSELAGGLAHEIRNPLSTLKVNLQLLSEDLAEETGCEMDPDLRRRALQRLETLRLEMDRLHMLLDDFLKLVTRRDFQADQADLNNVLRHLVEFLRPRMEELGIRMRLSPPKTPLICALDENLIKQALLNLCLNAQQAMPEGGELLIELSTDADRARIDITDSGVGIDAGMMESLFKPFFSTKKGGSGLGLSLTRRIVHEHGGEISVQSELGRGSRFTVHIPLATAR